MVFSPLTATEIAPSLVEREPVKAWTLVALLSLANALSAIDRFSLALLVTPIKRDLHFSDTQIALLQGVAFALFYTTLSLPIARFADRSVRKFTAAASIGLWSIMTMMFGIMRSFAALFLARVGVGCGESTLNPVAYSMLSDIFPKTRVAFAIGVYMIGFYVGGGFALFGVAWLLQTFRHVALTTLPVIGQLQDWRMVFLVLGLPGLVVAALMLFAIEPARAKDAGSHVGSIPLRDVLRFFFARRKFFLCLTGATSLLAIYSYGASSWVPTFFVRSYDLSIVQVGYRCGLLSATLGPVGAVCSGLLAQKLARDGREQPELVVALAACVTLIPVVLTMLLFHNLVVSMGCFGIAAFFGGFPYPVIGAVLTAVAPNQIRAQVSAAHLFVVNLLSLVLGPLTVALLTDQIFHGERMLFKSLAIVTCFTLPISAILFGRSMRYSKAAARVGYA